MEETIKQIKKIYDEILNIGIHNHSDLKAKSNEILKLLIAINKSPEKEDLGHTIEKEISRLDLKYKKVTKKDAAKVRLKEYNEALASIKFRISQDIGSLFNK
jgi:hypothetical protein